MKPSSRLLPVAKWGGVVVCAVVLLAWIASVFWWIGYLPPVDDGATFHINHGRIHVWIGGGRADDPGWRANPLDRIAWGFVWPGSHQIARDTRVITIPFWLCFVVASIPTMILIRLAPRRPLPGHCRCGYNLTGNVSGACPECGSEARS